MNLRKLAKASNQAQKQAAGKAEEGKEKDIKVDSKILISKLYSFLQLVKASKYSLVNN